MALQQLIGRKAELCRAVGAKVLEQHIAFREQLVENRLAFALGKIERYGTFVAIAGEVIGAQIAGERRAPTAGLVAAAGALELDDVGAEVAEHLPAEWAGQHARGVEHAYVVERGVRVRSHSLA